MHTEQGEFRKKRAAELTSYILHKHYCENDSEAFIAMLDDPFSWFGTGENEYAVGRDKVASIFREFIGLVPKCNLSGEEYEVIELSPDIYLCTGRLWIESDRSTNVIVRVHQRTTMVFRWHGEDVRCCHISISNPYIEMVPEDVGFPTKMARHSYEYLQEQIEEQKKLIARQTAELSSIYNTVPCVISRWLRTENGYSLQTFNRALVELTGMSEAEIASGDWPQGFCTNIMDEDVPMVRNSLDCLKVPGDQSTVDFRVQSSSGEYIYMSCNNQLLSEDESGQVIQKIAFDITRRVELEKALERQSFMDSLTGLFNRNRFNTVMQEQRERHMLGVACFDINGLKQVNDQQGHGAGDAMICSVADHIYRYFPGRSYRTGGDEFVVIDDLLSREEFQASVDAVMAELAQNEDIHVSAGCSWRDVGCNLKEQCDEADMLMYRDKERYYSNKERDRRGTLYGKGK